MPGTLAWVGLGTFVIFSAAFVIQLINRKKQFQGVSTSLNLQLFKILIASHPDDDKGSKKENEIFLKMEQLYSGLSGLRPSGWFPPLRQFPVIALEIALPKIGREAQLYAAVPHRFASTFEKIVLSLFPGSRVEQSRDYNIFNADGVTRASRLTLEHDPVLPISTYEHLGQEPFSVIAGAFAKLKEEGEGAALQIMLRAPTNNVGEHARKIARAMRGGKSFREAKKAETDSGWGAIARDLVSPPKKKDNPNEQRHVDEETAKQLEFKGSRVGFDANIRLLASAPTSEEAGQILGELESGFLQFASPQGNSFHFSEAKGRPFERLIYQFSFRTFDAAFAMYLNASELASVFHFPKEQVTSPHVEFLESREAMAPSSVPKDGLLIGRNVYRGVETPIFMTKDDRRRHVYVIGQTGTGKTALMKNMILQDIENGDGLCFIDPHGETAEELLGLIPRERLEDVIYFDPGDIERPLGLNFLEYDTRSPEQKTFLVNELFGIFQKLYSQETMGPMFEQYFRNSTLLVMEDPPSGNTLLEIVRVFSDKEFRELKLSRTSNLVVRTFWRQIAEKASRDAALSEIAPYIISKIDTFLANDIMRPIIAQEHCAFDFRDVMDKKKIVLVNLSKGRLGELNSYLLGLVLVGRILMAAFSRGNVSEHERPDFYLYIDEFQNVTTKSIATILAEARKYRLNLTIAHQYIGQLEEEIRKAVFGNVGTMISFRIGEEDAEMLEEKFRPTFSRADLTNINNYHAYVDLLVNGKPLTPFGIKTYPPKQSDRRIAAAVRDLSRLKYGRPRDQVEAEITHRFEKFI